LGLAEHVQRVKEAPVSPQQQRERALAIAARDGLIATPGTNGWWVVERPVRTRRHARYHLVRVVGHSLTCDCVASQHGHVCAHRACVHAALVAEWERAHSHDARHSEQF
jgi:hypothetical protein